MKFAQPIIQQFCHFSQSGRLAQAYLIDEVSSQLMPGLFDELAAALMVQQVDQHSVSPDDAESIKIDQIRSITDRISRKPAHTRHLIAIYPAERMNAASANALLKMLEEPPGSTCFILMTSKMNMLLPTILSRVIKLKCTAPMIEDFKDHPDYQQLYPLYKDHPVSLYLDQESPLLLSFMNDLSSGALSQGLHEYEQYDMGTLISALMQLYSVHIKKSQNKAEILNGYQQLLLISKRYSIYRSLNKQILLDRLCGLTKVLIHSTSKGVSGC